MWGWLRNGLKNLGRVWSMPLNTNSSSFFGMGQPTTSGEAVTEQLAMTLSAVFLAVKIYGDAHAAMPFGVFAKGGSKREYADYNPAHKLLHQKPNPEMNAGVYWRLVENHRLLWGASYSEIEWNGRGEPKAIWPVEPWRVVTTRNVETKRLEYKIHGKEGGTRTVYAEDLLIFPNITMDGVTFKSAIEYGAETIGGAVAAQKTGNKWFDAGGVPQGFVKHPGKMEKPARDNFRREWRENAIKDRGNIGILFEDMDWINVQMPPEALQLLQTRQFNVIDVSRLFNIQPHKLMEMGRATYANVEQGDLEFVKYSLIPAAVDKEQEVNEKLLKYPAFYSKFNFKGFLRGDTAAQIAFYDKMRGIGAFSLNDIFDNEDMDRIGPAGDIRVVNSTYIPIDDLRAFWEAKTKAGQMPPDAGQNSADDPAAEPQKALPKPVADDPPPKKKKLSEDPFFVSEKERMERRLFKALSRAAKSPGNFLQWMDDYLPKHQGFLEMVLRPTRNAFVERAGVDVYSADATFDISSYVAGIREALLSAAEVPAGDFEASIKQFIESQSLTHKPEAYATEE